MPLTLEWSAQRDFAATRGQQREAQTDHALEDWVAWPPAQAWEVELRSHDRPYNGDRQGDNAPEQLTASALHVFICE